LEALSRELGVEIYRLEAWRNQALEGMESALKKRDVDPLTEELKSAKQHIGELTMEVEVLRKEVALRRPLAGRKSRK
jgi:transposase